jgi:hypothetical protein
VAIAAIYFGESLGKKAAGKKSAKPGAKPGHGDKKKHH